jgi:pectate lyase
VKRSMKKLNTALTAAVFAGSLAMAGPAQAATPAEPRHRDLGREVIAADDGWGAAEGGTTGGSTATAENVFTVHNRSELVAAVAGDTPKIVYVDGDFDVNVDDANNPLSCADYADPAFDFDAYVRTYDPAVYTGAPTGPLEDARKVSDKNQNERVNVEIGSNTTVIGRPGSSITGIQLAVESAQNVIVRNMTLHDAYTCFPGWNGTDWKTNFDSLVVSRSSHVWIDHVTLDDGDHPDAAEPVIFGEHLLRHDGLLDIVRASDLVTVSWSKLAGHDKAMLFGNGDTVLTDIGKLRITMHHNELQDLVQRGPRVRFGQVHVYNNLYTVGADSGYLYSWGVGIQSSIYAQNNAFELAAPFTAANIIGVLSGTAIHEEGTYVNGHPVNVLAAYNAAYDPDLASDVGWTPQLHGRIDRTASVAALVRRGAGASLW